MKVNEVAQGKRIKKKKMSAKIVPWAAACRCAGC